MSYTSFNADLAKMINGLYSELGEARGLIYHLADHTDRVRRSSYFIAKKELVSYENMRLLNAASLVHDIGNIVSREGHEELSAEFAKTNLPYFGFNSQEIELISGMVMATKIPQQPTTLLEMILVDADMSLLGDLNWPTEIDKYRLEIGRLDLPKWYNEQISFLENHKWFTQGAKDIYETEKNLNIEWLKQFYSAV